MSQPRPIPGLSPKTEGRIRRLAAAAVLLLAITAAILSFAGLRTLALNSAIDSSMAWLLPVLIDGLVLTGSLGVIAATLSGVGTWYPWMLTIFGVAASVAGNVAAAPDDLVAQLVHATPPIVFALAIEGLLRIWRAGAENRAALKAVEQAKAEAEAARELARAQREAKRSEREAQQAEVPQAVKQITPVKVKASGPSSRQLIQELLVVEPNIAGAEVARRLGIDPSHARKLLRELRGTAESAETTETARMSDPATEQIADDNKPPTFL